MAGSNYSINFAYKNFEIKGVQRGNIEIKISRSMAKKYDEVFENATDIYHQGDCWQMKLGRYLIGFLFLMALLITFGHRGLVDNYYMNKKLVQLKSLNNGVAAENDDLKKKIVLLRSDLVYIESIARSELGMVKKGDIIYRLSK